MGTGEKPGVGSSSWLLCWLGSLTNSQMKTLFGVGSCHLWSLSPSWSLSRPLFVEIPLEDHLSERGDVFNSKSRNCFFTSCSWLGSVTHLSSHSEDVSSVVYALEVTVESLGLRMHPCLFLGCKLGGSGTIDIELLQRAVWSSSWE